MTPAEIDIAEAGILDLLKVGTVLYPQLVPSEPFIAVVIKFGFHALRAGIADGSIRPDGRGGLVPNTNSRVMPDGSLRPYNPAIDDPARRTHTGL